MAEIRGNNDSIMLQINTSGAWKNVLTFKPARRAEILASLAALAGTLGDDVRWCLLHVDGKREWLHDIGARVPVWNPITATEPAPLDDVMISVFASCDEAPVVFMAYRKAKGATDFYISGTCDQVVRGAYAFAAVMDAAQAPAAQKVAA